VEDEVQFVSWGLGFLFVDDVDEFLEVIPVLVRYQLD
jgi:hypothetical protein